MKELFFLAGLLVLMIGCATPTAVPATSQPTLPLPPTVLLTSAATERISPTTAPGPNTKHPLNPGETKTYSDAEAGFELDYPADWNMTPIGAEAKKNSTIYAVTIYSFSPEQASGQGIPDGESKMDIVVYKNSAVSLDAAVEMRKLEFANAGLEQKVLREETWTLANGVQVRHLQVSDRFGEASEVIAAVNGSTILLGGVGDSAVLAAIAQTLRPI